VRCDTVNSDSPSLGIATLWFCAAALAFLSLSARDSDGSQRADRATLAFDVVSIKPRTSDLALPFPRWTPEGGLAVRGVTIAFLVSLAFPEVRLADIVGLPRWTTSQHYDIQATAANVSPKNREERAAMLRALLRNRFDFAFHWEDRKSDVFHLTIARSDRRLGSQMRPVDIDCAAQDGVANADVNGTGARNSAGKTPDHSVPPSSCEFRLLWGNWEGDTTMSDLVAVIRRYATRDVIDRTGLGGYYRVKLIFDPGIELGIEGDRAGLGLSTALREQLGLRLRTAQVVRPVLIVDRLNMPSEN